MIGKNISKFRENLSISQRELGRRVGISGQMVSKIENNLTNPSMETLNKIADVLGCNLFDLTLDTKSLAEDVKTIESGKYVIDLAKKYGIKIQEEYENDGDGDYLKCVYVSFQNKNFKLQGREFHELTKRIVDSVITNILASENYNLLK